MTWGPDAWLNPRDFIEGRFEIGLDFRRLLKMVDGLVELSLAGQHDAEVVVR